MLNISPCEVRTCQKALLLYIVSSNSFIGVYLPFFTYFASKANAKMPAAKGAAAEVPEWSMVHLSCKSVVEIF